MTTWLIFCRSLFRNCALCLRVPIDNQCDLLDHERLSIEASLIVNESELPRQCCLIEVLQSSQGRLRWPLNVKVGVTSRLGTDDSEGTLSHVNRYSAVPNRQTKISLLVRDGCHIELSLLRTEAELVACVDHVALVGQAELFRLIGFDPEQPAVFTQVLSRGQLRSVCLASKRFVGVQ